MENLRNQIIDQIFKLLAPLRSLYKDEVDKVTNDLLNKDTKSLEAFISKYYNNVANTKEFTNLITGLVNSNLIANSFLEQIISPKESFRQVSIRPLNVRIETLNNIKKNSDLSKLDLARFPVALMEKKESIETNAIPIQQENQMAIETNVVPIQQENQIAVEIEPDYNTEPDIHIPLDSDNESEIPDFNNYQNIETNVDLPNTANNIETPVIETTTTPTLEIQNPNIISKDEIFESIQNESNQNSINDEDKDANLKNTTQLGQILQFPYGNSLPTQNEISNLSVQTNPVVTQDNYVSIEPTYQEETNMPSQDMLNQNVAPQVMPTFDTNQEEPQVAAQDNYVSIEPTYQEEPELPSMPLPHDMIKNEVPPTPQKTEEELKLEIENKVREAVREELKQEISELTNKTKEELKQEISEMATKTKEEVKQELTEKIREEEKNNILRIQNDYMNNATEFIKSLNNKDEEEIYTSLRLLNDLRYMSHCIAHLSPETLERFYLYIERKLNSPEKEFMDTIIEKRIKEILPPNISYNLSLEATNNHEVFRKTA